MQATQKAQPWRFISCKCNIFYQVKSKNICKRCFLNGANCCTSLCGFWPINLKLYKKRSLKGGNLFFFTSRTFTLITEAQQIQIRIFKYLRHIYAHQGHTSVRMAEKKERRVEMGAMRTSEEVHQHMDVEGTIVKYIETQ